MRIKEPNRRKKKEDLSKHYSRCQTSFWTDIVKLYHLSHYLTVKRTNLFAALLS